MDRFCSVPRALQMTLNQPLVLPKSSQERLVSARGAHGYDVTGVGASEFPARILVETLMAAGVRARFCPISTYAESVSVPPRTSLVVFSQGLSPNARLPFRCVSAYKEIHLFTSVKEPCSSELARILRLCDGVYFHLPESEAGTLLRVIGPACAALVALRFAALLIESVGLDPPGWTGQLSEVPIAYEKSSVPPAPLHSELSGCLASGAVVPMAAALMWKWQEALYTRLPPLLDVLSFAHGPLQAFSGRETHLLALTSPGRDDFILNLRAATAKERLHLRSLTATLEGPLALFEYDAQITALALQEMKARGISPGDWPGKATDGPLYEVGKDP